ncbi:MAG: winged helix-turn-helix domain-containing protein [Rickettsiales bacterium]
MRIAIRSGSGAVNRVLTAIIAQSGHHFTTIATEADLLIDDMLHPVSKPTPNITTLQLVHEGSHTDSTLPCPFRPQSLIQRLMMLTTTQSMPLANGWSLDIQARALTHATSSLTLTEKECALLKHLASSHPQALTRDDLLEKVWGMAGDVDTHTLETHIYRLRTKLEPLSPSAGDIITENGAYQLAL